MTTFFWGAGSSYTGSLPNDYYKYGTFMVNVRGTSRFIIAHAEDDSFAVNRYSGSNWSGWRELIALTNIQMSSKSRLSGLPFTAPTAGILRVAARALAAGRVYTIFSNGDMIDGYQSAGGYVNLTIPMPKGTSISISSQSNVQDIIFDWYAFNF